MAAARGRQIEDIDPAHFIFFFMFLIAFTIFMLTRNAAP
jgi:hypothetical protein